MDEQGIFKFKGEPTIFLWIVIPIISIIYSLIWLTLFLVFGWFGKAVLILLIVLTVKTFLNHAIKDIVFYKNNIRVFFYFGKVTIINYTDIMNLQEIQQGVFIFSLIVIRTKAKIERKQKFSFFCPRDMRKELDNFLKVKGYTIKK